MEGDRGMEGDREMDGRIDGWRWGWGWDL